MGTEGLFGPLCLVITDPETPPADALAVFPGDSAQRYTTGDGSIHIESSISGAARMLSGSSMFHDYYGRCSHKEEYIGSVICRKLRCLLSHSQGRHSSSGIRLGVFGSSSHPAPASRSLPTRVL